MRRFVWRGLTAQLFAIVILPLIALLLVTSFWGLYLHRQAMRNLVGERDERAARAAASSIREQLNHRSAAVRGLALRVGKNESVEWLATVLQESEFLLGDFDGGLAFLTSRGDLLAMSGDVKMWESLPSETYMQLSERNLQEVPTFISVSDPVDGEVMMLAVARIRAGGAVAAGAFSPATLAHNALTNVFTPGEGVVAFVIDKNLRVLFQLGTTSHSAGLSALPGVKQALQGESGATFAQVAGEEHVFAYSSVPPVEWALVIEESWQDLASPLLRVTEYSPLVMFPALVLALIALWFGTSRIVRPLQKLETKAGQLGWGNFQAIEEPVGGIAEIRRLQAELVHLAGKVKASQQGLRGYINAITMGQEDERRRLARELHDDTLQSMIALNQRVQLSQLSVDSGPAYESLAEIQSLTEQTIQNLRRLTRALRPIYLEDLGLAAALEMLARETDQTNGLKVAFERLGSERRLPEVVELALYRIAQEALSNVVRHAQATQARLKIIFKPQKVVLEVIDNGLGFEVPESPAEFAPKGHFGLLGMYERAELIGAWLEIHSAPGQGTRTRTEYRSAVASEELKSEIPESSH